MKRATLLALAGASALGALAWLRRSDARPRPARLELQRWEGEGGSPTAVSHRRATPADADGRAHAGIESAGGSRAP